MQRHTPRAARRIGLLGGPQSLLCVDRHESVQGRLPDLDALEQGLRHLNRRNGPIAERSYQFRETEHGRVGHRRASRCCTTTNVAGSISKGTTISGAKNRPTVGLTARATRAAVAVSRCTPAAAARIATPSAVSSFAMRLLLHRNARVKPCPLGLGKGPDTKLKTTRSGPSENVRTWGQVSHPRGPCCGGPNAMMQGSRKPSALAVGSFTSPPWWQSGNTTKALNDSCCDSCCRLRRGVGRPQMTPSSWTKRTPLRSAELKNEVRLNSGSTG